MLNTTQIKCPQCGKSFEPGEAFKHELEEKILKESEKKHLREINMLKEEKQNLVEAKEKELEDAKKRIYIKAREKADEKAQSSFELKIKELQEAGEEEKARSKKLQEEILKLTREIRKARQEKQNAEVEMQKKLAKEEGKIRQEARKTVLEEHELKDREKAEQLRAALKTNEELKRKLQEGSQQTQGEVLELELEEVLKREFPTDNIKEIKKGQRGADILQEVIDKRGQKCGTILWESKNAKWQKTWPTKLKEDQRQAKAHLAVIVATNPPEEIETYVYQEGIWITTRKLAAPLALALRFNLVKSYYEKLANVGKNEKTEILYQYVTSLEFVHRIEAIIGSFDEFQGEVEKEKRFFHTKWARQEKQLRKMIDHTHGMYGDLQDVVGKSLPEIKTLKLESGDKK